MENFRCRCDTQDDAYITQHTIGTFEITYCTSCWDYLSSFDNCEHKNTMLVQDDNDGKSASYTVTRRQCLDCTELIGSPIKKPSNFHTLLKSSVLINEYSEALSLISEIKIESQKRFKIARQKELEAKNNIDAIRNRFNQENEKVYPKYLASAEWREKRLKVLERDNYLCQSCLTAKAQAVHHLTYRNVGCEPLFDLVSVCNNCHDIIHLHGNDDDKCRINNWFALKQKYK